MIDTEKLLQITALDAGAHDATSGAMCAMEAVAWIAGEPWSDAPQCASPVVAAFVRSWNDALPDADRTRLLLPLIPEIVGTRTTDADEEARAWMATDWLVRTYTPRWLRVAGLAPYAVALENLAPIDDHASANAAGKTGAAAWDAARAAAGDAVGARLFPIVAETQSSAQDLVRRMCAVGRVVAAAEKEVANDAG